MFETRERYPRNYGVIDQVNAVGLDVKSLQPLIFGEVVPPRFVKGDNIRPHFEVAKRERLVLIEYRLCGMNGIEFDQASVEQPDAKLSDLICRGLRTIEG